MTTLQIKWAVCLAAAASVAPAQVAPTPPVPPTPHVQSVKTITNLSRANTSYLGVAAVELDANRAKALKLKDEHGVEVKVVDENSPASKAGLKENDVILDYNGQRVEGLNQFIRLVSETPAGHKATLSIVRNGTPQTVTAVVEARAGRGGFNFTTENFTMPEVVIPDMPSVTMSWRSSRIGIETESLGSQLAGYFGVKEGVLVRSVTKNSAAEHAGVKAGDVIVKANGETVQSPQQVSRLVRSRDTQKTLSLNIVRDHKDVTVEVPIENTTTRTERR